jgi:hypothetical protein
MRQELPFSKANRPWLTADCIEAMNEQFMVCISKLEPDLREALREWAAAKVEIGYCIDRPELLERCRQWGEQQGVPREVVRSGPGGS